MKLKVGIHVVHAIQFQLHMTMVKPHIGVGVPIHISIGVQLEVQIFNLIFQYFPPLFALIGKSIR